MFTSIVVGVDGSEAGDRALRMACGIAQKYGAGLQVSHTPRDETVTFAAEAISGFYVGPNAAHQELLIGAAEKVADRARDIAAQEGMPDVQVHVGHIDPAHDVLELAGKAKADLIVTGRRGLGNLSALVLGSTSQQITKDAKCACLTVP